MDLEEKRKEVLDSITEKWRSILSQFKDEKELEVLHKWYNMYEVDDSITKFGHYLDGHYLKCEYEESDNEL
jgi:hypothetical protein